MNNTTEYWDLDGVSLHQYGWSVATFGGSRYDLPSRRGGNVTLARRPGTVHRPKLAAERVINLVMWLTATDPATGAAVADPRVQFNDSWDFLRRAVWRADGTQVQLTRRWELTVDGTPQIVEATALAEISDNMAPTMQGRQRAEFTMQFLLASPYFYGDLIEETISVGQTVTVNNPGHDSALAEYLTVDLVGALTNPRLTNSTPSPDVYMQYNAAIPDGVTQHADIGAYTVADVDTGVNNLGKIVHSGSTYWMGLLPGDNTLTLTGTGAGSAIVRFRPPYV